MRLIKLNTRSFRLMCLLFGMILTYYGYRQSPSLTEPTLGIVESTVDTGFSQVIGSAMLIIGSFIASASTIFEGIYAMREWSSSKKIAKFFNFVFAIALLVTIAFLTWPGFKWAAIATLVICIAYFINRIVQHKFR